LSIPYQPSDEYISTGTKRLEILNLLFISVVDIISIAALITLGLALFHPAWLSFISLDQQFLIFWSLTTATITTALVAIDAIVFKFWWFNTKTWDRHPTWAKMLAVIEVIAALILFIADAYIAGIGDLFQILPFSLNDFSLTIAGFPLPIPIATFGASLCLIIAGFLKYKNTSKNQSYNKNIDLGNILTQAPSVLRPGSTVANGLTNTDTQSIDIDNEAKVVELLKNYYHILQHLAGASQVNLTSNEHSYLSSATSIPKTTLAETILQAAKKAANCLEDSWQGSWGIFSTKDSFLFQLSSLCMTIKEQKAPAVFSASTTSTTAVASLSASNVPA